MDLARDLSALAAHVDWPPTPEPQAALEPRTARRRRRRPLVLALAVLAVAIAAAFAVPQSRGAILRFFHLGAATIVIVDRLPAAEERPLAAGIGPVVSLAEAKQAFRGRLLVPPLDPLPPAHVSGPSVVSFLFSYHQEPVLFSEFAFGEGYFKKLAGGSTSVEGGNFPGHPSIWITGSAHDVYFQNASPRLAGNVLIWESHGVTYRLESRSLTKIESIALARSLSPG